MIFRLHEIVLALLAVVVFPVTLEAQQVFTSTNNTWLVNASVIGEPDKPDFGKVRVKKAPTTPNNIALVRKNLKDGKIPDKVANTARFLGNAGFASQISDAWSVKETSQKLKQRPATAPDVAGVKIRSRRELRKNRKKLADDVKRTFIFSGEIRVPSPIFVGSNKTIWLDGTLIYNGVDVVPEGGAAFTPRPTKHDGVFSVRTEAEFRQTFPTVDEADREFNRQQKKFVTSNRKKNVVFLGTQRGRIIVQKSTVKDGSGITLPKACGIVTLGADNVVIKGVRVEGALNAFFISSSTNVNILHCYTEGTVYRAIHLLSARAGGKDYGFIKHNLLYNSDVDGIDVDAFSNGFKIIGNVIIGSKDRYSIWTEIDAHNNLMDNNVAIVLEEGNGGFEENGTELVRKGVGIFKGNRYNSWLNNSVFYADKTRDGFVMRKGRFILFDTITFKNNYVWTLDPKIGKNNPKFDALDDVYYLIKK